MTLFEPSTLEGFLLQLRDKKTQKMKLFCDEIQSHTLEIEG